MVRPGGGADWFKYWPVLLPLAYISKFNRGFLVLRLEFYNWHNYPRCLVSGRRGLLSPTLAVVPVPSLSGSIFPFFAGKFCNYLLHRDPRHLTRFSLWRGSGRATFNHFCPNPLLFKAKENLDRFSCFHFNRWQCYLS